MNERILGENIRACRLRAGLTLADLAKRSDLTKGALSKIEKGRSSSPISTLMRIADALGVAIADFFAEPQPDLSVVVTRKGEGDLQQRAGIGYSYEALALAMRRKNAEPFILTVKPEDKTREFRHKGEEFLYCLSGRMDITIGDRVYRVGPGDSVYFDPNQPHSFRVQGKRAVRFLCLFVHEKPLGVTVLPKR